MSLINNAPSGNDIVESVNTLDSGKQNNLTEEQLNAVNSGITDTLVGQIGTNQTNISTIQGLIPNQATSSNQLADKDFVNSSIQTNTGSFDGVWATYASIPSTAQGFIDAGFEAPTVNNYLVITADETHSGGTWRYKYTSNSSTYDKSNWHAEYAINDTPLTSAQIAALNSGITEALVTQIGTNQSAIAGLGTDKQDKITGAATTITSSNLTANKAVITNNNGKIAESTVTSTELGYLSGASSNIQSQLNNKASTSLDNLNASGQMVIDSQNGTISNCILDIPQDIKIEINNGIITLKSGCKLTLTGSTYSTVTVENDVNYSAPTETNCRMVVFATAAGVPYPLTEKCKIENVHSGDDHGFGSGKIYYDSTDKIIYTYEEIPGSGYYASNLTYPLAVVDVDSTGKCSFAKDSNGNDMVFNGAGFIGHHAFIHPGVKVLASDGFNTDGSLKSLNYTTNSLIICELPGYSSSDRALFLESNSYVCHQLSGADVDTLEDLQQSNYYYQYVKNENRVYQYLNNSWNIRYVIKIIDFTNYGSTVTGFTIRQPVRLATTEMLDNIQSQLVVDSAPTQNSTNLVTSGGVYTAIQAAEGTTYTAGTGINITDGAQPKTKIVSTASNVLINNDTANNDNLVILGAVQGSAANSIAIGPNSVIPDIVSGAIQIGPGTNSESNTLYIGLGQNNYKILGNDGKIPDARLSSNIARMSDATYTAGTGISISAGKVISINSATAGFLSNQATESSSMIIGDQDSDSDFDSTNTTVVGNSNIIGTGTDGDLIILGEGNLAKNNPNVVLIGNSNRLNSSGTDYNIIIGSGLRNTAGNGNFSGHSNIVIGNDIYGESTYNIVIGDASTVSSSASNSIILGKCNVGSTGSDSLLVAKPYGARGGSSGTTYKLLDLSTGLIPAERIPAGNSLVNQATESDSIIVGDQDSDSDFDIQASTVFGTDNVFRAGTDGHLILLGEGNTANSPNSIIIGDGNILDSSGTISNIIIGSDNRGSSGGALDASGNIIIGSEIYNSGTYNIVIGNASDVASGTSNSIILGKCAATSADEKSFLVAMPFDGRNGSSGDTYKLLDLETGLIPIERIPTSGLVTIAGAQNITGEKTFVGDKRIKFKQSVNTDKLGFTLFKSSGKEIGYLEFNPNNLIDSAPLLTLGNYAKDADAVTQVGFRRYSEVSGALGAYNLLTPLIADAKTPFNLTTTYTNFYLPLGFTDGTTTVKTAKSGVVDLSTLNLGGGLQNLSSGTHSLGILSAAGDYTTIVGSTNSINAGEGRHLVVLGSDNWGVGNEDSIIIGNDNALDSSGTTNDIVIGHHNGTEARLYSNNIVIGNSNNADYVRTIIIGQGNTLNSGGNGVILLGTAGRCEPDDNSFYVATPLSVSDASNGEAYKLLDLSTGLIPNERLSCYEHDDFNNTIIGGGQIYDSGAYNLILGDGIVSTGANYISNKFIVTKAGSSDSDTYLMLDFTNGKIPNERLSIIDSDSNDNLAIGGGKFVNSTGVENMLIGNANVTTQDDNLLYISLVGSSSNYVYPVLDLGTGKILTDRLPSGGGDLQNIAPANSNSLDVLGNTSYIYALNSVALGVGNKLAYDSSEQSTGCVAVGYMNDLSGVGNNSISIGTQNTFTYSGNNCINIGSQNIFDGTSSGIMIGAYNSSSHSSATATNFVLIGNNNIAGMDQGWGGDGNNVIVLGDNNKVENDTKIIGYGNTIHGEDNIIIGDGIDTLNTKNNSPSRNIVIGKEIELSGLTNVNGSASTDNIIIGNNLTLPVGTRSSIFLARRLPSDMVNPTGSDLTYKFIVSALDGSGGSYVLLDLNTGIIPPARLNIATSVSASSTNSQPVGAKLFYDTIGDIESLLHELNAGDIATALNNINSGS